MQLAVAAFCPQERLQVSVDVAKLLAQLPCACVPRLVMAEPVAAPLRPTMRRVLREMKLLSRVPTKGASRLAADYIRLTTEAERSISIASTNPTVPTAEVANARSDLLELETRIRRHVERIAHDLLKLEVADQSVCELEWLLCAARAVGGSSLLVDSLGATLHSVERRDTATARLNAMIRPFLCCLAKPVSVSALKEAISDARATGGVAEAVLQAAEGRLEAEQRRQELARTLRRHELDARLQVQMQMSLDNVDVNALQRLVEAAGEEGVAPELLGRARSKLRAIRLRRIEPRLVSMAAAEVGDYTAAELEQAMADAADMGAAEALQCAIAGKLEETQWREAMRRELREACEANLLSCAGVDRLQRALALAAARGVPEGALHPHREKLKRVERQRLAMQRSGGEGAGGHTLSLAVVKGARTGAGEVQLFSAVAARLAEALGLFAGAGNYTSLRGEAGAPPKGALTAEYVPYQPPSARCSRGEGADDDGEPAQLATEPSLQVLRHAAVRLQAAERGRKVRAGYYLV